MGRSAADAERDAGADRARRPGGGEAGREGEQGRGARRQGACWRRASASRRRCTRRCPSSTPNRASCAVRKEVVRDEMEALRGARRGVATKGRRSCSGTTAAIVLPRRRLDVAQGHGRGRAAPAAAPTRHRRQLCRRDLAAEEVQGPLGRRRVRPRRRRRDERRAHQPPVGRQAAERRQIGRGARARTSRLRTRRRRSASPSRSTSSSPSATTPTCGSRYLPLPPKPSCAAPLRPRPLPAARPSRPHRRAAAAGPEPDHAGTASSRPSARAPRSSPPTRRWPTRCATSKSA